MELIPQKSKDLAHRLLDDEAIVVHFGNRCFYSFNPVGTFIWERCDGSQSLAQIAQALAAEYQLGLAEANRDCRQFIEELVGEGLLSWNSHAPE